MIVSRETPLLGLLTSISKSLSINKAILSSGQEISGLTSSAVSLILSSINNTISAPVIVQFEDNDLAEKLYLSTFSLTSKNVAFFPATLINEMNIPGFNLENERYRSESVNFIRNNISSMVFSSFDAANEPAIDGIVEKESLICIESDKKLNRQGIIETLAKWGYEQTDHTETPKTFSVRGGILDVFLPYSANPIRIEFFGNTIESVRMFNPRSQRTIKSIDKIEILPPPIFTNKNDSKLSLLDLAGKNLIKVVKHNINFNILFEGISNIINNIGCQTIVGSGEYTNDFSVSIDALMDERKPQNLYLFSENPPSKTLLDKYNLDNVQIVPYPLERGFYSEKLDLCCLSAADLNQQNPVFRSRWAVDTIAEIPQKEFSSLEDLDWGDYLVHQDFGIGLYRGLEKRLTHDNVEQECIKIEYADNANVYVPVDKFNRVHRMIVTGDKDPTLSALNSPKWGRQKQIAKDSAKIVVKDLVNLYSSRNQERGFKYNKNNGFMHELETSFPYEETPGQKAAIDAVISDMEKERPVDRLICGDVGFGKTEVALRAALKAIISGKKVLFLTPTTILADQHFISTKGRLEPLGVQAELLSRFKTKKQQQEILEKMFTGSTDLVIGTHRLLSQDVRFPDLGLLIIDEEHRFGVKHKEKIRHLRATIDVLTLTATPIPRTLQQSLLGIRDISRINTPPKTRQPIKTFVQYFNWKHIQSIINKELNRGGQVYFLYNDISSIPFIFKKLSELFPGVIIGVAHSKMSSKNLESTVLDFFDGKVDILLCTTIIESGLDVANANTLIINNAQNFGLSQLYQIRGRVGRSYRQAYCYLLLPRGKAIGESARKRLKAIEQFTSLGSGYAISLKDLEIRGAGSLFGYKQSGHIATVGFEMYCKLLQEAVDETLGKADGDSQPPKISIPFNAMLESVYIALVQDRLHFYSQFSEANSLNDINKIEEELADRFGQLPKAAQSLIYVTKLRVKLTGTAVSSISVIGSDVKVRLSGFLPYSSVQELIGAVEEKMDIHDLKYSFSTKSDELSITVSSKNLSHSLRVIELFVELFSK